MIAVPLRTSRGLNAREHHHARARRVKAEREAVAWMLAGKPKPETPCVVSLTRIAPSKGLDDDNLAGALKAVRDQIAEWLGVDDGLSEVVRYTYHQRKGPWGVEIDFASLGTFMRAVDGLRPLAVGDPIPMLYALHARTELHRGSRANVRLVCSRCRLGDWERSGHLYSCWNCSGSGDTVTPDGDGWKRVKPETAIG